MNNTSRELNLKEKFNEYFHELESYATRSERFYESLGAFTSQEALAASMVRWLEAAFIQGARVAAQDAVDTLYQYGTTVAGINDKCYTRTEAYDVAAHSLMVYFTKILDEAEK